MTKKFVFDKRIINLDSVDNSIFSEETIEKTNIKILDSVNNGIINSETKYIYTIDSDQFSTSFISKEKLENDYALYGVTAYILFLNGLNLIFKNIKGKEEEKITIKKYLLNTCLCGLIESCVGIIEGCDSQDFEFINKYKKNPFKIMELFIESLFLEILGCSFKEKIKNEEYLVKAVFFAAFINCIKIDLKLSDEEIIPYLKSFFFNTEYSQEEINYYNEFIDDVIGIANYEQKYSIGLVYDYNENLI